MPNNEDGVNTAFLIWITIAGFFGILNVYKWFNKPTKSTTEEYEKIISDKDTIILALENRIRQYQKILEDDTKIRNRDNME